MISSEQDAVMFTMEYGECIYIYIYIYIYTCSIAIISKLSFYSFQGRSQNYIKGALNLAGLCSVETQIHYLAKHLVIKENAHNPVYDYSYYTVK